MPEIEVRPAVADDIPTLTSLDHHYTSDHVWQFDFQRDREIDQITANFRKVRLPRAVRVDYPRSPRNLVEEWTSRDGLLVAIYEDTPVGYISLITDLPTNTTWVTDLIVERRLRRKGVGSALLLAALEWADHMDCLRLVLEMQLKNHPAIMLALKLGFEFCGYMNHYYKNHETGIFFDKSIR
jgi:GNAT superfamily N-acetyltransferase